MTEVCQTQLCLSPRIAPFQTRQFIGRWNFATFNTKLLYLNVFADVALARRVQSLLVVKLVYIFFVAALLYLIVNECCQYQQSTAVVERRLWLLVNCVRILDSSRTVKKILKGTSRGFSGTFRYFSGIGDCNASFYVNLDVSSECVNYRDLWVVMYCSE